MLFDLKKIFAVFADKKIMTGNTRRKNGRKLLKKYH